MRYLLYILYIMLTLLLSNSVYAGTDLVFNKTIEACMGGVNGLEICESMQAINQRISELGERTAKRIGLDGTAGIILASSTQVLVERRIRFNTTLEGANGNIQVSPETIALGLEWKF